jgi:predicted protein tyrosine phosphatase
MVKLREIKPGNTFIYYASMIVKPVKVKILDIKSIARHSKVYIIDTDTTEYIKTKDLRTHLYDESMFGTIVAKYYKTRQKLKMFNKKEYADYNAFIDEWPEKMI